jgi:high affinity Mn2+ porin
VTLQKCWRWSRIGGQRGVAFRLWGRLFEKKIVAFCTLAPVVILASAFSSQAQESPQPSPVAGAPSENTGGTSTVPANSASGPNGVAVAGQPGSSNSAAQQVELWNWHVQGTAVMQGYPPFPAKYSRPANSLPTGGQIRETVSVDVFAGLRLWPGAEFHFDGLMWQGYGLHNTLGIDDFASGEAYKAGTAYPKLDIARLFIRQNIDLGGEQEDVPADGLTLAGRHDISRIAIAVGRIAAIDIFDNNSYASDPTTQFLNWAFISNVAWDYPADSLGFTTGATIELRQPNWALRYGFFQIPAVANTWTSEDEIFIYPLPKGIQAGDGPIFKAWGMVTELERRYNLYSRPGALRFLAFLNQGRFGSYKAALSVPNVDITQTYADRRNFGFGLNWEQAITENSGVFSRLGWNQGRNQAWMFTDVNYTASLGLSLNGESWGRPHDTYGLAGVISGITRDNQRFLEAGGLGILAGDGKLNYGWEKVMETYYDFPVWTNIHLAADYQFVGDPAFNKDRGPVNILAARVHLEF